MKILFNEDLELRAFNMGRAYALGREYAKKGRCFIARDGKVIFRKTESGQTIAIEEGKIVGGAGSSVGPDKLPTLSTYISNHKELEGDAFSKKVFSYLRENISGKKVENPKGLPNAKSVIFPNSGLRKTANAMNEDKAKVLPYLLDVYRTGNYAGSKKDGKSHGGVVAFHYTEKKIETNGENFFVTVVSKETETGKSEFSHYAIGKADKINDSKKVLDRHAASQMRAGKRTFIDRSIVSDNQNKVFEFIGFEVQKIR